MDAKQFLAEFGHIANAPKGIQNLRQLIMGLSLAGKLFPDVKEFDEGIEDRIYKYKKNYYKRLNIRTKPFLYGEAILDEFDIPASWKWKRVGELCDLQTGATPSRQRPEYFNGDIRWLVSGDIHKGEITECEGRITEEGLKNSNCKIIPKNSVLIALNGQGKTRATVAILRVSAACNQSLVAMIPYSEELLTPEYLFLALKYRYFEIRDITGQKQRRGLNMRLISESSIPLAPLEEQKRIVAKVDELMALCDKLEAQQQKRRKLQTLNRITALDALANAQSPHELKEAWLRVQSNMTLMFDEPKDILGLRGLILDSAVKGNLVLQNSYDADASELVLEIAKEKEQLLKNKKIGKQTKFQPVKEEEKPFNLPKGWMFVRLGAITNKIGSGSTPRGGKSVYVNKGVPFLRSQNIWDDGIRMHDVAYIPKSTHEKMANTAVMPKDILLNITGASLGRCALVPDDFEQANVSQHVTIIRATNLETRHYLHLCMLSPYAQKMIWGRQVGMAREGLSKKVLEQFEIPLPPIEEQRRIVEKVASLMTLCDELEKQLAKAKSTARKLAQAAVASITGTESKEEKKMKAPKTELVSKLKLKVNPNNKDQAPLSAILAKHNGELSSKALWNYSGMDDIDKFYQQLKTEMACDWIVEPEKARMIEKDADNQSGAEVG
ncbi:restriction endonuclease subunit S [Methylobacter sp. sgz302048]|uniref:restriction endonuclease subunit S n=1 Tax=Methylobacter sp. sgz302048 TaxID=3455945 RepID=UPI003FA0EF4C